MNYQHHTHHSEETYHHFFRVRRYTVSYESFRGGMIEHVERECLGGSHHVVAALPYDPERGRIILVEQYRIGAMVAGENPWQYEIVAGSRRLEHLYTYLGSPGGSAGRTHLYLAEIDSSQITPYTGLLDEGEDIAVHSLPYTTALDWLAQGKLDNANTLIAMQAFLLRHPQ